MPVRVICENCEKIFSAAERLRGKLARCPQCGDGVPVPELPSVRAARLKAESKRTQQQQIDPAVHNTQISRDTTRIDPPAYFDKSVGHINLDLFAEDDPDEFVEPLPDDDDDQQEIVPPLADDVDGEVDLYDDDDIPEPLTRRKRKRSGLAWICLILFLVLAAGGAGLWYTGRLDAWIAP